MNVIRTAEAAFTATFENEEELREQHATNLSFGALSLPTGTVLPPDTPLVVTLHGPWGGEVILEATVVAQLPDGLALAVAGDPEQMLKKGQRTWLFRTPRGLMPVQRKIVDPVWTKPDWAFVEKGQKVPPPNSPKRYEKGTLGKYALDLGDGILIHGTKDLASLGKKASHGCIRVGPKMLEVLFTEVEVGTMVYVF